MADAKKCDFCPNFYEIDPVRRFTVKMGKKELIVDLSIYEKESLRSIDACESCLTKIVKKVNSIQKEQEALCG